MNTAADTSAIRLADGNDHGVWNDYVLAHPEGSFFHRFEWHAVMREALGHQCHFLIAERGGRVAGVMPVVEMRSLLFGHSLGSMPFATYAGPLGDDEAICAALERRSIEIAHRLNVGALELRYRHASGASRPVKTLYETFSKPIEADEEANMKAIRSKQRNIIRKGIKAGLEGRVTDCRTFYPVYSESVRNLGTPVFPRTLFETIAREFGNDVEFFGVFKDGRAVSAAQVFYFRDQVCPYYWGGLYSARRIAANDFLAWQLINRAAIERGCTLFDFGRSKKETGAHQWKRNLGFEPAQLYYEYELVRDDEMPEVNPNNPKYRFFIETWKKLPLSVSQIIGARISRSLG